MTDKNQEVINNLGKVSREHSQELTKKIHIENLTTKILNGETYDSQRNEEEIGFFQAQHVMSGMEIGKRIYLAKLNEEHGNFYKLLERKNVHPRQAQNYMAIYLKFSNTKSISHLGTTKMIAALSIPDEEIAKLESEGYLIGIPKDKLKLLSVSEFQAEIRKWQGRTEKVEKREAEKDKKIAELQKKLDDIFDPYADEIEKNIEDRAHKIFLSVKGDLIQIRHIADAMGQNPDAFTEASKSQLCGLMDMLLRVTADFREQVNHCCWSVTEDAIPDTETLRSVPIQGKWNKDLAPEAYDIEPGVFNNLEPKTEN